MSLIKKPENQEKENTQKPEKPPESNSQQDIIPDYDYLFDGTDGDNKKGKTKFFGKLFKLNAFPFIATLLLYIIQASPTWVTPILTAEIINIATESIGHATADTWTRIIVFSAIIFAFLIINVPITMWRWKIMSKMLRRTSAGIKSSVVRKLQSLSITYHKDMETGRVQSKFLRDTDNVDGLFRTLVLVLFPNIISVIISTVISVYKNGLVALFFLLVIPVNVAVSCAFRKTLRAKSKAFRKATEGVSGKLSTMLSMIPVTKAHGLENNEITSAKQSISRLAGAGREMDKVEAKFGSWIWVVNMLLSTLCLIFCSVLAILGYIKIGDIVLYQSMFNTISGLVTGIISMLPALASGFDAVDSVSEIMNAKDVEVNFGKKVIDKIDGGIKFEHVYYCFPDATEDVIKDFSLNVKPGECIAVVGSSGSGKSTLMNLLIGFMMPRQGRIFVDGEPIDKVDLSEYRHHISVVPQNSILFNGSIKDNITYGLSKYSEKDLERVMDMANLNEFVKDMPNGIDSDVGEHGDKLSGGQKQRVTIARALIRNPSILILDEATSALDNISEYHVQQAIERAKQGRTTFIVAHRLSTIRNADRIVVMENGSAVECGTYDELMAKKGKFFELKSLNDMNIKKAEDALS